MQPQVPGRPFLIVSSRSVLLFLPWQERRPRPCGPGSEAVRWTSWLSRHSPLSSASSLSHLHWSPGWVCRAGLTSPKSACLSVNYPVKHSLTKITLISFSYACYAKSLQSCPTLQPHGPQPARLLCPWGSPDKNTGVGCHALLQGIFPTQGLNAGLFIGGRLFTTSATWETHSKVSGEGQIDKIYENALQIPSCFIKIN